MKSINLKKVAIFLVMTFSIDWLIILIFYISGGKWNTRGAIAVALGYMFIPMICAIIVQKVFFKDEIIKPLGIHYKINKWWVAAWLIPPGLALGAFGLALLFPGVSYSPDMSGMFERYKNLITPEQYEAMQKSFRDFPIHPFWIALGQGLLAGITVNAVAGFGEELGWRGFLHNELQKMKFWPMSLLIGFIWGVWHAPIILMGHNYPGHPVYGVFMMILFCILLGPIISFIRIRSNSVISAAIFHGTVNGTAGLALLLIKGGNDLTVGITGLAGMIILIVANVILYFLRIPNIP